MTCLACCLSCDANFSLITQVTQGVSKIPQKGMIVTWTGGYLLYLGRPGLDQEVEGGGDEGEADVLHHLGLVRRHRDRPLLQVHLNTTTLDTLEMCRY